MKKLLFLCFLGLVACSEQSGSQEVAFIENVRVFEEFEMKKSYDTRMEKDMSSEMQQLDSMNAYYQKNAALVSPEDLQEMKRKILVAQQYYDKKFEELSTQYTLEVNERLNGYIKAYCEEKGISILLGSGGQGNVMYVKDTLNVTDDLIQYVNKKFAE